MNENQKQVYDLVASMYKNEDGSPVLLSPTQCEIFATISMRLHNRVHCETFTRFGKSRTTALAVLTRASSFPEKWAIVAGTKEKAKIIMNYINAHIFDNEYVASRFRMDKGDSAESIKRNRNKSHISFDVGKGLIGEIFVCSAKEALGFGAKNVIEDEASLIEDPDHALVMRMLGDDPHDNFLFKIGNPFYRNHFLKSRLDPAYHKILVDCYKGLEEGRISRETIEEMSKFAYFDVLYKCEFPSAESIDDKGWSYLLTELDVQNATNRWGSAEHYGTKKIGVDVARGGRNFNVWVLRGENYAKVLKKSHDNDLMSVAGQTIAFAREHGVQDCNIFIDDVGVGGGVTDKMKEEGWKITPIKEGAKCTEMESRKDPTTGKDILTPAFANMKSQLYAGKNGLSNWLKRQGQLEAHEGWEELTRVRFKKNGSGATMLESKEDMRKRGEESPDVADALMLTFGEAEAVPKAFNPPDPMAVMNQGRNLW